MKIKLEPWAICPTRAHETDAGLDLYAERDADVWPGEPVVFDVGVHVQLPPFTAGFLKSKSGLNVNHNITSEGVIDVGYTGSIRVKLYNNGRAVYHVKRGDKISQLVVVSIEIPALQIVDELDETDRGENGFGSTGR